METLLGGLAFAVFLLAQVAAVVAVHAERKTHRPNAFEGVRRTPRAKAILDSGS
jgi:hypothetical protein